MSNIQLFESKQIRTVWNETDEKWYFVVAEVIQVLSDTPNPSDYIKKMRNRDEELSKGWGQFVTPLSVDTSGGKQKIELCQSKRFWCQEINIENILKKIKNERQKRINTVK